MLSDSCAPTRARVLVVDDDVVIGKTVQRYLREYDVTVADCVAAALEQLAHHSYDLVLLDLRLPDGLGDAVIEVVRNKLSSLPIILMSGDIDPEHLAADPQVRADDFLEKPFVRETLISKIEQLLTATALRRQAAQQRAALADLHESREREIDVARTIFDRIFARGHFPSEQVRHIVLAANRLAGDAVFGAWASEDRYRWMLGDVTGHTLSSALVTMPLASAFYSATRDGASIPVLLGEMERELSAIVPASMFCAGAMCELDRKTGTLDVWNGGSPDILIRHAAGAVTLVPSNGMPIAADRFTPTVHKTVRHKVVPGDRIYAFSDGMIEIGDGANRQAEFDSLLEIAQSSEPAAIFDRFLAWVLNRTGATGHDDDISLIEVIV